MRAVVQRVRESRVEVKGSIVGAIGPGLLIFLGVGVGDKEKDGSYLAEKIANLRIFPDDGGIDEPFPAGYGRKRSRRVSIHPLG